LISLIVASYGSLAVLVFPILTITLEELDIVGRRFILNI